MTEPEPLGANNNTEYELVRSHTSRGKEMVGKKGEMTKGTSLQGSAVTLSDWNEVRIKGGRHDTELEVDARLPTEEGLFRMYLFRDLAGLEHIALVHGDIKGKERVLTRVHSECMTGDLFGSLRCDCGPQLRYSMRLIVDAGMGLVIYLRQEGRGIGLAKKLRAYNLQDEGLDTVDANIHLGHKPEERDYTVAKEILEELGVSSIDLVTNNPDKAKKLSDLDVLVEAIVPIEPKVNPENLDYLRTKALRMKHELDLERIHHYRPEIEETVRYLMKKRSENGSRVTVLHLQGLDGSFPGMNWKDMLGADEPLKNLIEAIRDRHDTVIVDARMLEFPGFVLPRDETRMIIYDPKLWLPLDHPVLSSKDLGVITVNGAQKEKMSKLKELGAKIIEMEASCSGMEAGSLLMDLLGESKGTILLEGPNRLSSLAFTRSGADLIITAVLPFVSGSRDRDCVEFESVTDNNLVEETRVRNMGEAVLHMGVVGGSRYPKG